MARWDGARVVGVRFTDEKLGTLPRAAAQRVRAEIGSRLRGGRTNLEQLLQEARTDELLGRVKLVEVLQMMPSVGKAKAREIMTELGFAPTRRLRGLNGTQRRALLARFGLL